MSYNPYSNSNTYSPYYQQSAIQDGHSQSTDQSGNTGSYQTNPYQPLSAYQNNQRQQSSTPHSSATGPTYGAQGYGGSQAPGAGSDGRTSVDTSALGNLAYASSLGQRNTSLQQVMGYKRSPNNPGYGGTSSQHGAGHERNHSNGGLAPPSREVHRAQTSTSSPSFGYSSNSNTGNQAQQPTASGNEQGQAQYMGSQQPRPPPPPPYHSQAYPNNKQPSRPSSGRAVQRSHSKTASQGLQSPTVHANQTVSGNMASHAGNNNQVNNTRVPTPQQQQKHQKATPSQRSAVGHQAGNYTPNAASRNAAGDPMAQHAANPTNASQPNSHFSFHKSPNNSSVPSNETRQPIAGNNQSRGPTSQNSTPTAPHAVTTVDPSHVFNDIEYQRRQEEAEAARKKADDDLMAALGKANTAANAATASLSGDSPQSKNAGLEKKNQTELKMKAMIEETRDLTSKDPTLFSQVWEDVKKAPPTRAPSQSVPQGSVTSPVVVDGQGSGSTQTQLPPESELPAAEAFPEGFDRGRYPAQRRRRGNAQYTLPKKPATAKGTSKGTTKETMAPAPAPGNQTTPTIGQQFQKTTTPQVPPTIPAVAQMVEPTSNDLNVRKTPSAPSPSTPSRPSSQPSKQPPRPSPAGGTYWPEDKKRQLAEAARAALTSAQPNVGKAITADELHQLLDQNPSYTQMCEILEYRGFVVDRGQFARTLLAAVPDLGTATSKTAPPTTQARPQPLPQPQSQIQSHGLPAPSQTSQAAPSRPVTHPQPPKAPIPHYMAPYMLPNSNNQQQATPKDYRFVAPNAQPPTGPSVHRLGNGLFVPATPNSAPAAGPSKTGVKWADDSSLPRVQSTTKQDMARKRSFGDIVDLTQGLSDDEEPPRQRPRVDNTPDRIPDVNRVNDVAIIAQSGNTLDDFRHNPTTTTGGKYFHSNDIVRPMNKRQDALRRSSYNPKTIARDILVAIGKHPTMVPLNAHLDKLRENFAAVNHDSDLSTFRWDLVDPGGPPPPSPPPAQTTSGINNEVKQGATRFRPYQLHSHSSSPITPSGPKRVGRPSVIKPIGEWSSSPATSSGSKRKGRPPGAKNKNPRPDKGILKKPRNTPTQNHDAPIQERGNARSNQEDSTALVSETPSQSSVRTIAQRPHIQTNPMHSSGLRNVVTPTDGIAVVIPSPSPSVAEAPRANSEHSAKRGSPSKMTMQGARRTPSPSYKVFKCQWDKCPAELHSYEKLKKHVRKHRNQEKFKDGSIPCLWAKCYSADYTVPHIPKVNANGARERLRFRSEAAWDQHVENMHINAIARDLGENPYTPSAASAGPGDDAATSKGLRQTTDSRQSGRPKSAGFKPSTVEPLVVIPD